MFAKETRVLIIDDMMMMRKIVKKALQEIGFTDLQEAEDGNGGWELLQKSNPPVQLVISDWNMPHCTGLELLKRVRADAKMSSIPFILLTAEAEGHQVKEAVESGVSNYITKPFTPELLKSKIEQTYVRLGKK